MSDSPASEKQPTGSPAPEESNDTGVVGDFPVEIISIKDSGSKFTLNEKNLAAVLDAAEQINPKKIVIVSVVGAFRSGKSFLLDLFLRYLRATEDGKSLPSSEESKVPAWMQDGGDKLLEGNVASDDKKPGFLWRGGKERMTTGIWMYGQPFVRTLPDTGEKVAVILMDTQGLFDMRTSAELTAAIFGLSTLVSSYQIYNLNKQIQEDQLQQLDYFTQFSIVALKEFAKAQKRSRQKSLGGPVDEKGADKPMHPFQCVEFLVRDWANFDNEDDVEECLREMPAVLEQAMNDSSFQDQGTRDQIKAAFEEIKCFLLPHPGLPMTKKNWDGSVLSLESAFVKLVDLYVKKVFDEHLITKKIQGREISPHNLSLYMKAYGDVFSEGKMPSALTLVQAISQTTNLCAKDEAFAAYKARMKQLCGGQGAVQPAALQAEHEKAFEEAMSGYDCSATFGEQSHIDTTRETLAASLMEEFEALEKANSYKLQAGLVKYIVPLIAAVAAFSVDLITDWTCDAWSENCRSISKATAFVYFAVFLVVGWELFRIYRSQGSVAAGMGAMALGKATLEKVQDIQKSVSSANMEKLVRSMSSSSTTSTGSVDSTTKKDR